jgi:hypothetical protein
MKRVYRPQASWEDSYRVNVPSCTVIEPEPTSRFSGLLDAQGNRLMVALQSEPVGFVVFKEK